MTKNYSRKKEDNSGSKTDRNIWNSTNEEMHMIQMCALSQNNNIIEFFFFFTQMALNMNYFLVLEHIYYSDCFDNPAT